MTEEQPDITVEKSNEEDDEEKLWHIYLTAEEPLEINSAHNAIYNEDYKDILDDNGLIPELAELKMVSFYYRGTRKNAYLRAQRMVSKLNSKEETNDARWTFESGSIMLAE